MRASATYFLLAVAVVVVGLSASGESRRRVRSRSRFQALFGITCPGLSFESQCGNGTAAASAAAAGTPVTKFSNGCARCKCSEGAARCVTSCPAPSSRKHQKKCAKLTRLLRKQKFRRRKQSKQFRTFHILCPNVTAETVCTNPRKTGFRFVDGCRLCNCTGVGQAACESPTGGQKTCTAPTRPKHNRKCAALFRKTRRRYKKSRRHNLKRCFQKFCKRNPTAKAFLEGCKPCQCRQRKCKKLGNSCTFVGTTGELHQRCRKVRKVS